MTITSAPAVPQAQRHTSTPGRNGKPNNHAMTWRGGFAGASGMRRRDNAVVERVQV
jgi:hypothetical protein